MKKKVVCKPSEWKQGDLKLGKMTLGKEYEVLKEDSDSYLIIKDGGFKTWMYKGNFDVVEPKTPCPLDWKPADGYSVSDYEAECIDSQHAFEYLTAGKIYLLGDVERYAVSVITNKGNNGVFNKMRFATPTLRAGSNPKQPEQITLNDEDVRAIADAVANSQPPNDTLKDAKVRYMEFKNNQPDPVNHPTHYTDGGIETADYIVAKKLCYFGGNAIKYISRAGKKDPNKELEDWKKAQWYVNKKIQLLEKQTQDGKGTREN